MAPLGLSGGSQFSSTVLPDGVAVTVSMRGAEGAEGMWRYVGTLKEGEMCLLYTHALMLFK